MGKGEDDGFCREPMSLGAFSQAPAEEVPADIASIMIWLPMIVDELDTREVTAVDDEQRRWFAEAQAVAGTLTPNTITGRDRVVLAQIGHNLKLWDQPENPTDVDQGPSQVTWLTLAGEALIAACPDESGRRR